MSERNNEGTLHLWIEGIFWILLAVGLVIFGHKSFVAYSKIVANTKISVRLNGPLTELFAGELIAQSLGYYQENNLEVIFNAGGAMIDAINMVVSGYDDFGIDSAVKLAEARCNGISVRAVSVDLELPPVAWMFIEGKKIREFIDFKNAKIGLGTSKEAKILFTAVAKRVGLELDKLNFVNISNGLEQLLKNEVDVIPVYINWEPIKARSLGLEVRLVKPLDYSVDPYGQVIFTSDELINKNPDVIINFVNATRKGWEFALKNPNLAAKELEKYGEISTVDRSTIKDRLEALLRLNSIENIAKPEIGDMDINRWRSTLYLLKINNIVGPSCKASNCFISTRELLTLRESH